MKRVLASALVLGVFSLFSMSGCAEKSEVKEKVSTPEGSTETTTTVKSTGDNPPANSAGQTGDSGAPK